MQFELRGKSLSLTAIQPECSSQVLARSLPLYRIPATNDEGSVDLSEVLEVTSPQVSLERMGLAAGCLRGPVKIGGGYLLDLQIPLSGEEGDVLLGELVREESDDKEMEL